MTRVDSSLTDLYPSMFYLLYPNVIYFYFNGENVTLVALVAHIRYPRDNAKHKRGELWYRLAWEKSETLSAE
jgi:hypothetical protein